jgi:hypothetical protein
MGGALGRHAQATTTTKKQTTTNQNESTGAPRRMRVCVLAVAHAHAAADATCFCLLCFAGERSERRDTCTRRGAALGARLRRLRAFDALAQEQVARWSAATTCVRVCVSPPPHRRAAKDMLHQQRSLLSACDAPVSRDARPARARCALLPDVRRARTRLAGSGNDKTGAAAPHHPSRVRRMPSPQCVPPPPRLHRWPGCPRGKAPGCVFRAGAMLGWCYARRASAALCAPRARLLFTLCCSQVPCSLACVDVSAKTCVCAGLLRAVCSRDAVRRSSSKRVSIDRTPSAAHCSCPSRRVQRSAHVRRPRCLDELSFFC